MVLVLGWMLLHAALAVVVHELGHLVAAWLAGAPARKGIARCWLS